MVLERYGPPDVLKLVDVEKPAPKPHDVLVRVHAASINDWDWGILRGTAFVIRVLHGVFAPKVRIIGCDIAGRVEAVGDAVTSFRPGDEVYGDLSGSGFGAFAEYACAPEKALARKPPRMTFEQAAAIPQAGMLAVQGLIDVGRIRSGQTLLLNGAGGGVGTFALQIAKLHDVEVTVVDKAGKLDMLRAMGAEHVIDYREADFTKLGARYDLILDATTTRSPFAYARALNPGGAYVTVGGSIPRVLQALALGPLLARTSDKHMRMVVLKPNKDLAYMNELFERGAMVPVIDGPYAFADLPDAFRHFGSGDHKGKIIVTMV
jgi:NADPH:quinone reductase-like Zn-dependent oxidoreductase